MPQQQPLKNTDSSKKRKSYEKFSSENEPTEKTSFLQKLGKKLKGYLEVFVNLRQEQSQQQAQQPNLQEEQLLTDLIQRLQDTERTLKQLQESSQELSKSVHSQSQQQLSSQAPQSSSDSTVANQFKSKN